MTTLLALDTATEACSVALLRGGEVLSLDELSPKAHTKRILPMVDEILTQAGIALRDVNALVYGRGPGSFTGVRIGCGIVQGLALGADLPVIGVSNLTAMAQAAYQKCGAQTALCAIDARMGEVYFSALKHHTISHEGQAFDSWQPLLDEQVLPPECVLALLKTHQINADICVGTGWGAYPALASLTQRAVEITLPSAQYMLTLAQAAWACGETQSALEIEPVYIRNQVTWKKLPGRE
ncbi:tRNA (adenosine(37)-N6)-threonylcarbamoyltransferase complex dimerization subunit type 1 TsaB [Pasteurellaceae bacterium HPA106]|uniref:tRNA (adenosine(37)-N6)-threonylcarbamoyltransferase complex dimerization subunit type 1 TsaB n=1 Tax=Spirabiliibacterium pneumoniae TaxID=221400 RepID=UPI001AADFE1A|nr:tRNA (adenosine(37)-N6)-threonylcarbamoyltransferase complex dimerization subunit type 1 TsaB [Spirabiliibacterium pneumoniae]MBE2896119.1 tRNA (adenosine(37)-N6)-threonylcarbamoyltransferase complex dimerization subunit type 1 TsaB [Spirabiliibacterium pneumoniae]